MSGWHNPKNFLGGELARFTVMNEQVYDNLGVLKSRPLAYLLVASTTTTSTTFVEMTSSGTTIVTYGGNIWVTFNGSSSNSGTNTNTWDIAIDGVRMGDTTIGCTSMTTTGANRADCLFISRVTTTPPPAGTHTLSVYWKTSAGTAAGNGRLWVEELC